MEIIVLQQVETRLFCRAWRIDMDAMRESFECTGAGGEWKSEISSDDPSVRYAWNIWRDAWQAAVREAINEWEKPWSEAAGETFIQRLRKLEMPNASLTGGPALSERPVEAQVMRGNLEK